MVLPPSLKALAQEPVQLDRTMHDPSFVSFVLLAPSSPLLSVDVAGVTMQAMLPLTRPAPRNFGAVFTRGRICCAFVRGNILQTFAYKGGHLNANV
jgi:hypothetical protein